MKTSTAELRAVLYDYSDHRWANVFAFHFASGVKRWAAHHDDVTFGGTTWVHGGESNTEPVFGPVSGKLTVGLDRDELKFKIAPRTALLNGVSMKAAALRGDFDGVKVEVSRAFYSPVTGLVVGVIPLFAGIVTERPVKRGGIDIVLMSINARLTEKRPLRVIQAGCPYNLGDASCGVNLALHTSSLTAASGSTVSKVRVTQTAAANYWQLGSLTVGGEKRTVSASRDLGGGVHECDLSRPLIAAPSAGASVTIIRGCDHKRDTCRDVFENIAKFGGFPDAPAAEAAGMLGAIFGGTAAGANARGVASGRADGQAVPVVYGTARVPGLIGYTDKTIIPTEVYTYRNTESGEGDGPVYEVVETEGVAAAIVFCEAPVSLIRKYYRDQDTIDPDVGDEVSRMIGFAGTADRVVSSDGGPWTVLEAQPLTAGIHFAHACHLRTTAFAMQDGRLPTISAEIKGMCLAPASDDAHPADVVLHMLSDPRLGIGIPAAWIDVDGPDGAPGSPGPSSYRTYCDAMGWRVSRAITSRDGVAKHLEELLQATNSEFVKTADGKLRIVPLGDKAWPEDAPTYVPPSTSIVFDGQEFVDDSETVEVDVAPDDEVFNAIPVVTASRVSGYEPEPQTYRDSTHAAEIDPATQAPRGMRIAPEVRNDWIVTAAHAYKLSSILVQQGIHARGSYTFTAGPRWSLAELMDLTSVTEPDVGLSAVPARIREIEINEDGTFTIVARDWTGAVTPVDLTPQMRDGFDFVAPTNYPTGKADRGLGNVPGGTVTADMPSTPAADNLVPNPNSDMTPPAGGWRAGSWELAGLTDYPGAAYQGTWCRKVEALDTNPIGLTVTPKIPVAEGESVYAEAMVAPEATATNNGTLVCGRMTVAWINAAGTQFAWSYKDPTSSGYQKLVLSAVAPAGATAMQFMFEVKGQAKKAYIDNMVLRKEGAYRLRWGAATLSTGWTGSLFVSADPGKVMRLRGTITAATGVTADISYLPTSGQYPSEFLNSTDIYEAAAFSDDGSTIQAHAVGFSGGVGSGTMLLYIRPTPAVGRTVSLDSLSFAPAVY
jgi:uncharacterized phage protein (TIGR02218 family)